MNRTLNFQYSTHTLFLKAANYSSSNLVLDIGCLDGKDTLTFRDGLPGARVLAFEANPYNYQKIKDSGVLESNHIEVFNFAVSDRTDFLKFYLYNTSDVQRDGIASLKKRDGVEAQEEVEVQSVRIEDFLAKNEVSISNIAVWIDVEGAAFEVITSFGDRINEVSVVHVELENEKLYQEYHLQQEVEAFLKKNKFICLGKQMHKSRKVGDYVYINSSILNWFDLCCLRTVKVKSWLGILARGL
ncbi:MAG: FkbM family methyltransferase [Bacteroidota bacterium]